MDKLSWLFPRLLFLLAISSCFLIILLGTSAFKYAIFALSLATIFCTYKTIKFNSLWLNLKGIVLPWLPWVFCTIVLMFIHGTKSLTKFPNAFLILCLLFIVLSTLSLKRKTLILYLCAGLVTLNIAISVFLYEYGLHTDILGTNRNPLFAVITIIVIPPG